MNQPAFEHNGALVARERFYQIACDPRRSVAVEACAGAGKTWMLVSRMVRALMDGCAPQDILAITFTKKAAGEMRQRLQEWLREFAQASDDQLREELRMRGVTDTPGAAQLQTLRTLHATLLQSGRPVQIRTFHSWFAALLRTAPLGVLHGLGLPTAYQLLEDDKKASALVWRRFQMRVAADAQARPDYEAAVAAYGRFNAHKALESALSKRTEFALADGHGVVDRSVQTFAAQFPEFAGVAEPEDVLRGDAVRAELTEVARILGRQKGAKAQQAGTTLEQAITQGNPSGMLRALFTQKEEPRKLGDKFEGALQVQQAQEFLQRWLQAERQHAAWQHQQRMARLTRLLIAEYAQLKRERGWIDMGDLECAALALLSNEELSGWVQERLDARVRHLLIDEFQDTNPLQWQALHAWLSGYAGAGNAPSVFVVGDPKQSIYRFRRAEPQVFRAAKEFVRAGLGGDLLSCDHTRRNAVAVVDAVNAVMIEAQAHGQFEGFRAHSTESKQAGAVFQLPAIAQAPASATVARSTWRDSLSEPRVEVEENRKVLECRQAAHWLLAHMHKNGLQASDVMVLARKRERLGLMQAELAALGIAAQQPEKNDLMDFAEVQDLVALLDALVSPRHDLSLARALKSPLFSVGDDDLVQLALARMAAQQADPADAPVGWMQVLLQGAGLPPALQSAARTLQLWQGWARTLPPHDVLSAIYQDGDVLARFAAAAPDGARAAVLANLNALLHAALAVDGGRFSTSYSLVRALRAGGNKAPVRSDADAVRLLTIHGAKGLEAPLVLLLDTDAAEPRAESMGTLVDWPGEASYPRRFVFLASETRPPACVVDALAAEQAARSREELNALYVALTRTQQSLVLSSVEPRTAQGGSWWNRLTPHAQQVTLEAPVDVQQQRPATTCVLPVLPELPEALRWAHRAAERQAGESPVAQDSLESRIGQAMHRLLEWLPTLAGGYGQCGKAPAWSAAQQDLVGRQFALDADQVAQAVSMAKTIACGEGAWAWDARQLQWSSNEVALGSGGRLLRLDRLVQRHADGVWWVLDYKSHAAPHLDADLCAQLQGYRAAVQKAHRGQTVCAAFLTAQGALIELKTP